MEVSPILSLTERCLHYERLQDVPWDLQKYWQQRYSIFSAYDYDIRMTDDAWFGVTPEPVANKIAEDLSSVAEEHKTTLVDLFAGAGGNPIAFALSGRWSRIIAIEKDADTLACAQHNAGVYGCADFITWVHGDCFDFLRAVAAAGWSSSSSAAVVEGLPPSLQIDPRETILFASPPWGGVSYRSQDVFDLSTMHPYNLESIHSACKGYDHLLYLPRTSDLRQIANLAPPGSDNEDDKKIEVVQYCMVGASKAMVAYIPAVDTGGSGDAMMRNT